MGRIEAGAPLNPRRTQETAKMLADHHRRETVVSNLDELYASLGVDPLSRRRALSDVRAGFQEIQEHVQSGDPDSEGSAVLRTHEVFSVATFARSFRQSRRGL